MGHGTEESEGRMLKAPKLLVAISALRPSARA